MIGWWGKDDLGQVGWHNPGSGRTGVSGSGNEMSRIFINHEQYPWPNLKYKNVFGYWNGVLSAGNDFGLYHVKVTFLENSVDLEVINPNP